MKSIFIYFILTTYITSFISCSKFLNGKANQKLALPTSLSNLQALLDNSRIMNEKSTLIDISSADNYWIPTKTYNSASTLSRNVYIWKETATDFTSFPNDWSMLYDVVYYSNIVLDNIDKINKTSQNKKDWDNVKGAAYLYRAYSFFKTCVLFAPAYNNSTAKDQLGIVLRLTSNFNAPSVRASLKESINQIISDIDNSIKLLPLQVESTMRPSKATAYALMARVAIYLGQYTKVINYADSTLMIKDKIMDYNEKDSMASIPFEKFNDEVIFQKKISLFTIPLATPNIAKVDTVLYNEYASNDLRKKLFFTKKTDNEYRFKGNYDGSSTNLFTGIATDEIYLMRAEAYARQNKKDLALKDLNHLLIKRWRLGTFSPITTNTSKEALNIILKERRKELIFRGLRWMDIKRLNVEGENITIKRVIENHEYTLLPNSKKYAIPIPETVIQESGIEQNKYD